MEMMVLERFERAECADEPGPGSELFQICNLKFEIQGRSGCLYYRAGGQKRDVECYFGANGFPLLSTLLMVPVWSIQYESLPE
jgi:hypothetical protein